MLSPGDTLDWFRIEAMIGQGGMGAVYRAFDTRLDRRVAVKVLSVADALTMGGDPPYPPAQPVPPALRTQARARLVREARAAAAISHPSAVAIYHVGEANGEPYIVMELLSGVPLRAAMHGPEPVEKKLRWLGEIAEALAAAHATGIVHRDVKPDNVMILDSGRAKVLDFGIARREREASPREAEALATLTAPGAVVGTPAYLAPEQIHGEPAEARSDQFAWGITAYEVLTGELPWGSIVDATALIAAILVKPIPSLAARCPEAPPCAVAAVERALSRERDARFASMDELLAAFHGTAAPAGSARTLLSAASSDLGNARTEVVSTPAAQSSRAAPHSSTLPSAAATDLGTAKTEMFLTPAPAARPRPRRLPRAAIGAGLVALAVAGIFGARRMGVPFAGGRPHRAVSSVPAADAEYANGLDAYRHRSLAEAIRHLEHAAELDPTFAAAHVRLAAIHLTPTFSTGTRLIEVGRRHFAEARRMQGHLRPEDRAYLLALEPLAQPTPDLPAFLTAAQALARAYPDDPDALFVLSTAQLAAGQPDAADATDAKVVAKDPSFGPAYAGLCRRAATTPDAGAQALACFERCLAAAPASGPCHAGRASTLAKLGRCANLAEEGRAWDAVDPEHWGGLLKLTDALFAQGMPVEAVRDTLRRALAKSAGEGASERDVPRSLWLDASALAVTGDFDGALAGLRKYAAGSVGAAGRTAEAELAADVLEESGRVAEARAEIEAVSRESAAWTSAEQARLHPLQVRGAHMDWLAGRLKRADYVVARVADGPSRTYPLPLAPEDAHDVLQDAASAPDRFDPGLLGEAHLRAGDAAAAVPLLEKALVPCSGIEAGIRALHLHALLGEALEQTGDATGAAREYRRVLAFWGSATPPSVTANAVRARLAAMKTDH